MANLQDLGAEVAKLSEALSSQLQAGNHAAPGFGVDALDKYPKVPEIAMTRFALLEKVRDLLYLATGPADFAFLEVVLFAHHDTVNMSVLNEFDFFTKVPIAGGASYAELARATGLPEEHVRRILQYSFTMRVFAPDPASPSDRVVHTAFSAYVARNPLLHSWIGHNTDEARTAGMGLVKSLKEFSVGTAEGSQEINESGYSMAMPLRRDGSRTDFWAQADEEPWRVTRFAEAMQVAGASSFVSAEVVAESYDWEALGTATVVDVGGSDGHITVPVARKHPNLTFVVQDLPRLEPDFNKQMASATDVADRFTFAGHSFFEPQPLLPGGREVDVFFVKQILHDWPEKHAVRILQNLVPALKRPGGRVLLCESVTAPPEQAQGLPLYARKGQAAADMQMLMAFNSQERTPEVWKRIVAKVDPKLRIVDIKLIPGAVASLIEIAIEE